MQEKSDMKHNLFLSPIEQVSVSPMKILNESAPSLEGQQDSSQYNENATKYDQVLLHMNDEFQRMHS